MQTQARLVSKPIIIPRPTQPPMPFNGSVATAKSDRSPDQYCTNYATCIVKSSCKKVSARKTKHGRYDLDPSRRHCHGLCPPFVVVPVPLRHRPILVPTRTSVSSDARPFTTKSSSHSTTPFSNNTTIVDPPVTLTSASSANHADQDRKLTKRKIPQFLTTRDLVALVHRRVDAPHHHRTDADRHDASKLCTRNRNNLACVLPVHIQGTPNRLRLFTMPSGSASTDAETRHAH